MDIDTIHIRYLVVKYQTTNHYIMWTPFVILGICVAFGLFIPSARQARIRSFSSFYLLTQKVLRTYRQTDTFPRTVF